MVLRKFTIHNRVRYIPISEKTKETDNKPKKEKTGSLPRKQNKNISQNSTNLLNIVAAQGFAVLNLIMNCYFYLKNIQIR